MKSLAHEQRQKQPGPSISGEGLEQEMDFSALTCHGQRKEEGEGPVRRREEVSQAFSGSLKCLAQKIEYHTSFNLICIQGLKLDISELNLKKSITHNLKTFALFYFLSFSLLYTSKYYISQLTLTPWLYMCLSYLKTKKPPSHRYTKQIIK